MRALITKDRWFLSFEQVSGQQGREILAMIIGKYVGGTISSDREYRFHKVRVIHERWHGYDTLVMALDI